MTLRAVISVMISLIVATQTVKDMNVTTIGAIITIARVVAAQNHALAQTHQGTDIARVSMIATTIAIETESTDAIVAIEIATVKGVTMVEELQNQQSGHTDTIVIVTRMTTLEAEDMNKFRSLLSMSVEEESSLATIRTNSVQMKLKTKLAAKQLRKEKTVSSDLQTTSTLSFNFTNILFLKGKLINLYKFSISCSIFLSIFPKI